MCVGLEKGLVSVGFFSVSCSEGVLVSKKISKYVFVICNFSICNIYFTAKIM